MRMKSKIQDYTESEFVELMDLIFKENTAFNDDKLDTLLEKFELLTEHPDGTDLIYYPDNEANCSPEGITKIIKEWRKSQGLPLFKVE
ncbi:colicin immunity protein [Photobacterium sp. GB-27]|nr:colicin immunity protein [Photobacterium sp. GB-56]PSV31577.1 colicin immunity protein [Photobacterium sp. GB-27]PSV34475.1 colicin immunity protein [Photobacterium sp. GB-210]PSV51022.1 colicin immunity protein [Photobacterium sp. GB-1]PSV53469.1 colicin immunity protein [Photobacterium sp. GB-3]